MLLNDIEHLPKIVTDIDGIRDVLLAIEPEIIQLREDISNFNKELYVKTTNLFIERMHSMVQSDKDVCFYVASDSNEEKNKIKDL